jgi:hypothetical protein
MAAMGGGPPSTGADSPEAAAQDPGGAVDVLVIDSMQKTPTEN